jgi:PAS domain S-box-containing protein
MNTAEVYRPFLDSVPDALVLVSADGTIILANGQAESLFGYGSGELAGLAVDRLVPHRLRGKHPGHRKSFFGDPKVRAMGTRGELRGLRKDGTEFTVEINLAPVQTAAGLLVSAAIRDVSEQRRLQEQLERKNEELEQQYRRGQEANRLKSEFLANMSHELRTPLNAIIGFAEILHDGKAGALPPQQEEFTGDILSSARHLLQLINDVLDLAKVEAGKMEFAPQPLQLPKLVNEVRDVVRTLVARKRIKLSIDIAPSLDELVLDGGKLKQVLYNYLSNAIKFTHDDGEVTVRATPEGADAFRLEVRDTGIGIRPEDLGRLFVEFQQLDTSMSKKYQGTGLGLALTRRIVEAQGGSVGVASKPGKGSTFHAVLPRRMTPTRPQVPEGRPSPGAEAPVMLVVEDDPRDLAEIETALVSSGYAVEAAATGARAVALSRERVYAGITLDLLLPDTNGWEVLKAIRAESLNRDTPVVVVSMVADRAAAAAFAVQDYLVKPLHAHDIVKALWQSGVSPPPTRRVLIVDSDLRAVTELRELLEAAGYQVLHATDGAAALHLVETSKPHAAVVELQMKGGGLELLAQFRKAADGRSMPVIVSTRQKLLREELEKLLHDSLSVVPKGHGAGAAILDELQQMIARSAVRAAGEPGPP